MVRLLIASLLVMVGTTALPSELPAARPSAKFRISGTVVNAISGQALSRIQVSIGPPVRPEASQTITTREDGHFEFDDLHTGKYWLQARGRGFSPQRFNQHEEFSTAIAVGPGLSSEGLTFALSPDGTIVGTITDEQNEPISEARVMLFRTGVQSGSASTQIRNQVQTDDQGHYHLSHVPPGTYYIAVSARPWYADNRPRFSARFEPNVGRTTAESEPDPQFDVTYPLTFYSDVTDSAAATALTVSSGDRLVADINLTAVPCAHLRLTDSGVDPRQGFNAILSQNVFGTSTPLPTSFAVVGQRELEITGLSPGHYDLSLQTYGRNPSNREQQIDVSDNSEINIANSASTPTIKGIVQMEDGKSVPRNLNVMLLSRDEQNLIGQTSAKGEFEITPQLTRPGKYQVAVFGSPEVFVKSVSATGASLTGRELSVSTSAAVYLKITLAQGAGRIDGTALRECKPLAGAMIVLVPQDIQHNSILVRRDQSDSDGTFSLYNVLPGSYIVVAIQDGWNLPWLNPDVLHPYLKTGTTVNVSPRRRYDIKVDVR
jgi:hypothetical protein